MNEIGSNFRPAAREPVLEVPPLVGEFVRRRALKRKDRLFFVADREDRAGDAVARAFARGEFGNDVRDNVPLPGTGVLRLVDQHMIDAAVELVMHPAGGHAIQHLQRLVDQIVIVEQAALLLLAPVIRCRRGRDVQQRLGAVADRHGAAPLDQGADALTLPLEQIGDDRIVVSKLLGHHRLARRAFIGKENAEIFVHLRAAGKDQCLAKLRGLVLIGFASGIEHRSDVLPPRSRQIRPIDDGALDILDRIARIDAEGG